MCNYVDTNWVKIIHIFERAEFGVARDCKVR